MAAESMVLFACGGLHRYLKGVHKIPSKRLKMIIETGDMIPGCPEAGSHYCHMFRSSEFRDLLVRSGLEVIAMSASNCVSTGWGEYSAEIRDNADWWDELLRIELEAAQEEGCLAAIRRQPHPPQRSRWAALKQRQRLSLYSSSYCVPNIFIYDLLRCSRN